MICIKDNTVVHAYAATASFWKTITCLSSNGLMPSPLNCLRWMTPTREFVDLLAVVESAADDTVLSQWSALIEHTDAHLDRKTADEADGVFLRQLPQHAASDRASGHARGAGAQGHSHG
jgi:hypothetical protein